MSRLIFFFIIFAILVGCQANPSNDSVDVSSSQANAQNAPLEEVVDGSRISFMARDVAINVNWPDQWEYYETTYGLVMTEQISTMAANGELGGLLTHIFVPPLENLTTRISNSNRAYNILREVIS